MSSPIPSDIAQKIAESIFAGRKIEAIKYHREITGGSLKESKGFIDALEAELRAKEPERFTVAPAGNGCLFFLVAAAAIGGLAYWLVIHSV